MPRFAASHLGLFCLLMSHKKDALLIWINISTINSLIMVLLDTKISFTCSCHVFLSSVMGKHAFCIYAKTKALISAFVFAT